jgi:TctA family transporter
MMWSDGSLMPMVERPITLGFLIVSALLFVWPFWRDRRSKARQADAVRTAET